MANLSIRFPRLEGICEALDCQLLAAANISL
jgi:DNA-binding Xre family transcriptional regulator